MLSYHYSYIAHCKAIIYLKKLKILISLFIRQYRIMNPKQDTNKSKYRSRTGHETLTAPIW